MVCGVIGQAVAYRAEEIGILKERNRRTSASSDQINSTK